MNAILFDMDGTLLDSMYIWKSLAPLYLEKYGLKITPEIAQRLRTMSLRQAAGLFRREYALEQTKEEIVADLEGILEDYYRNRFQLKPYAQETVQSLEKADVPMAVGTATDEHLAVAALGRLEILDSFSFVQTVTNSGFSKSDERFYLKATERLGAPPSKTILVDDSLFALRAAKAAGLQTVGVYDENSADDLSRFPELWDFYLKDWRDWRRLLEFLMS